MGRSWALSRCQPSRSLRELFLIIVLVAGVSIVVTYQVSKYVLARQHAQLQIHVNGRVDIYRNFPLRGHDLHRGLEGVDVDRKLRFQRYRDPNKPPSALEKKLVQRVREPPPVPVRVQYLNFQELCADAKKVKDPWVILRQQEDFLAVGSVDDNLEVAIKVIFQEGSFSPIVKYHNFQLYRHFSVEISGLSSLLNDLNKIVWCNSESRSPTCSVALDSTAKPGNCDACHSFHQKLQEKEARPIKPKTPLSSLREPALIKEVKKCRLQIKELDAELAIKKDIDSESVAVDKKLHAGLLDIIETNQFSDPFLRLFWEEQQKAIARNPKGMRWHPMMIRFAIYLQFQSPRCYEALRSSGVIKLPHKSTLLDYTKFFEAKEGFQPHVFQSMKKTLDQLPEECKYGVIMHDEMSLRGDLVYDKRSDRIVGFTNPESWCFEQKNLPKKIIASHVLVFMVVGIENEIKESIGYFATTSAKSEFLFHKLWRAVAYLEEIGFKVIASTADKASPNQRLLKMHGGELHRTNNCFSLDKRPLFFISDPPHIMKTIRNNLESSWPNGRRCLWKSNKDLLWKHIVKVQELDGEAKLKKTALRKEHVQLTPSSKMSVRLAVQVLSHRVGNALKEMGPEQEETARFVLLCDRFFDCLNVRSENADKANCNPDLAPYTSSLDERFKFLNDFLAYLHGWKTEVEQREGFSRAEKEKMFLSLQTYDGITTTVRGFIGATKYLLDNGVSKILSSVFCQDPLENHFGRHRGLGQRSRNPSLYEYGHQTNKLHLQRWLAFCLNPKGNVSEEKRRPCVDNEPLRKIKRK